MTREERVVVALNFREPDRVPHFDLYWGSFAQRWCRVQGLPIDPKREQADPAEDEALNTYYDVDMALAIVDESPWPSQVGFLHSDGDYEIHRDGWRRLLRQRKGAYFFAELRVPLEDKSALDQMVFDSPANEARYADFLAKIDQSRHQADPPFIFCKVGGPYLRSSFLRGQERWLNILHVLEAGEGGGLVIGAHTIAPDISQQRYDYVMSLLRQYWGYPLRLP